MTEPAAPPPRTTDAADPPQKTAYKGWRGIRRAFATP